MEAIQTVSEDHKLILDGHITSVDGVAFRAGSTAHLAALEVQRVRAATVAAVRESKAPKPPRLRFNRDGEFKCENMSDVKAVVAFLRSERGFSKAKAKKAAHDLLHGGRLARSEHGTERGAAPDYQHAGHTVSRPNSPEDKRILKREKLKWSERRPTPGAVFTAKPFGPWMLYNVDMTLGRLTKRERDILHGKIGATAPVQAPEPSTHGQRVRTAEPLSGLIPHA
jgi:hypothetical protein